SERSVYVTWLHHGASEISLDGDFTDLRRLFPEAMGYLQSPIPGFHQLALSSEYLATSSVFNFMAFRPVRGHQGHYVTTRVPVGIVEDLDLAGNQLLLLGNPDRRHISGGIAWLGPVSAFPATDLRPLLHDLGGAGAPHLINCAGLQLGSTRFL